MIRERIRGLSKFFFLVKPRLLSWNVRGLNEGDKCMSVSVRNLLREWKVDIVCF